MTIGTCGDNDRSDKAYKYRTITELEHTGSRLTKLLNHIVAGRKDGFSIQARRERCNIDVVSKVNIV